MGILEEILRYPFLYFFIVGRGCFSIKGQKVSIKRVIVSIKAQIVSIKRDIVSINLQSIPINTNTSSFFAIYLALKGSQTPS